MAVALGLQHVPVGEAAHHRRMEVGGTGPGSPEILQQQPIAGHIVIQAAIAGGVHTGGAVEGVHAQAGVVGNGGQSAGLHDGLGLDAGVFREGGAGFLRLQRQPQFGLEYYLHPQLAQNALHLRQLALIMRSQYEFHHSTSPRISFSFRISSRQPLAHSSTSSCCSLAVKARPSPVP